MWNIQGKKNMEKDQKDFIKETFDRYLDLECNIRCNKECLENSSQMENYKKPAEFSEKFFTDKNEIEKFKNLLPENYASLKEIINKENLNTQEFLANIISTANQLKELQSKKLEIRNITITDIGVIIGGVLVAVGAAIFLKSFHVGAGAGASGIGYGFYNLLNLYNLSTEKRKGYLFNIGILMEALSVNNDNGLPYLGYHEKVISEEYDKVKDTNLKENWSQIFGNSKYLKNIREEEKDELIKILKSIAINYKIRAVLKNNFFYGIIGQSKSGKSTFLEKLLPGESANATSREPTTEMKPYKIIESENTWFTMLDYPHFSSKDINHKLQFLFSRLLLDYVFFVCRAEDRTDTDDIGNFLDLVNFSFNRRFIILLNKADSLLYENKKGEESFDTDALKKTKETVLKKFMNEPEEKFISLV